MERGKQFLAFGVVVLVSFFTYAYRYSHPPYFFWDENYHVAHAQKYLNRVFFMEPHPPLGKLVIAAGEWLIGANEENNQFTGTDHAKLLPPGFSFAGYRLFPVLLAWLTAPLLYLVLLLVVRNALWAMLLSFLYVFDNAIIVHARGAMLEGTQLFFIACTLLAFMLLYRCHENRRIFLSAAIFFGLSFGAVMTTKITGLILMLMVPALAIKFWPDVKKFLNFLWPALAAFAVIFISVWRIHFALGSNIQASLPDRGYYRASEQYKKILSEGRQGSFANFIPMLRDHLRFVAHYQRGVPKLNLCKQEENGSPFYLWPVGARAINYRWEKSGGKTSYLYLQANPAVWFAALISVLAAAGLLFGALFLPLRAPLKQPLLLSTFLAMYAGYMAVMGLLGRVMYLYHYFIPLLFAIILAGLVITEVAKLGPWLLNSASKNAALVLLTALVLGAFKYFSPLTYYEPLSDEQVKNRAWLGIWDLRCTSCALSNGLAWPICDPKVKQTPNLFLSGIRAESGYQDWGDPKNNRTVEDQEFTVMGVKYAAGFGVHANSSFNFRLRKEYSEFKALVGLPDYLKQKSGLGSVVFEVLGDGRPLWESPVMRSQQEPLEVSVSVKDVDILTLSVRDAGDGIDNDHACWLEPKLVR